MNFIDTHIHLQDFKSNNTKDIVKNAVSKGISKLVCASIQEKDWNIIAKLYEEFPENIVPAFGVHPWYVRDISADCFNNLEKFLQKYPHALVGETGLDRFKDKDAEPQNSVFKKHIELAKKYNRPLLIHAVKSQNWLEEYWHILPQKFVFHSYNGRREMLKKIISHGGYVSYSSSILKNKEKDKTLKASPRERILLETDAPYQGNYDDILTTAAAVAAIREENLESFAKAVYKNSEEFINVG